MAEAMDEDQGLMTSCARSVDRIYVVFVSCFGCSELARKAERHITELAT